MAMSLTELRGQVEQAMEPDRFRFRQRLNSLDREQTDKRSWRHRLERLAEQVDASVQRRQTRSRLLPQPAFSESNPIDAYRYEIQHAIHDHPVVVVCGDTGCGKSTQLPQICLHAKRGIDGLIGHTQPRRIAARTIASRIADELQSPVGQAVGFKIRFNDTTSPDSYIKLMTDGILLAESRQDRFLNRYDTIIIDEAHERSLNIDFLLGYLKRLLPRRPDLRLVITSATIDSERFSEHFSNSGIPAPVIEVSGRNHPVEIRYRPIESLSESEDGWQLAILGAIDELSAIDDGHILIFLPTERDIHEVSKLLRAQTSSSDRGRRTTEVLPLYSRLSINEQNRIFRNTPGRRIVIATNVAESSLTVPGIRYVIDLGTARLSRYSARSQIQRLPIEPISQASAQQRSGRCGRLEPGICIRCYSAQDFQSRPAYTVPEIQRSNLAAVILQLRSFGLGDIEDFPFLDHPKPTAITSGYKTLFELAALDEDRRITPLGRQLSRLPVDPRIGRMIYAAHHENCLTEVLIIAAALEVRDPRDRPHDRRQAADQAHIAFQHADSDFLTYLKLWDFYQNQKRQLSRTRLRKMCQANFLSHTRLREWANVHRQLIETARSMAWTMGPRRDDSDSIHRSLLAGLLSSLALRSETGEYTVASGGKARLWPGSTLAHKKPRWVMAAEFIETSGRYLRTVTAINPRWIEQLAAHLIKRNHSEPHWVPDAGATMAFERISLWGLPIVARRRVPYGPVDPTVSREIFIRSALVEGNWESQAPFLIHNRKLQQDLEQLQAKSRRLDLLKRDEDRFDFYHRRLPTDVFDATRLGKWRRQAERENSRILFMENGDLLRAEHEPVPADDFPDSIPFGNSRFPLEYRLEPGEEDDGITLTVPAAALGQLNSGMLGWLVP
ncbi:MAG: ATP-dependent RNA helicase HrpA, partial [Planctomycetaceae bacterium]